MGVKAFFAMAAASLGCGSGNGAGPNAGAATDASTGHDAAIEASIVDSASDTSTITDAGAGIAWSACGAIQCATVTLPRDYTAPAAGSVKIALARSLAVPSQRIGSLFINTGGPGGPVVASFAGKAPTWLLAGVGTGLTDQFDVIAFDPRGIGQSSPDVMCYTDAATQAALSAPLDPGDAGQWAQVFGAAQLLQQGCESGNDPALMTRVDTANVARDVDAIRALLGEPTISYLGYSYGTFIGAMYATLFPSHVRAMALDSPVMAEPDRRQRYLAMAPALEALLDQFFAWCAGAGTCATFGPEAGRTQTTIAAAYDALTAQLDAAPLTTTTHLVDGAAVQLATLQYLYSPPNAWPQLGPALAAAAAGDGSVIATALDGELAPTDAASNNFDSAYFAISALDSPLPAGFTQGNMETYLATQIAPIGPRIGLIAALNELPTFVGWPYVPPQPIPTISAPTAPPALLTSTLYDIVPHSYATEMQSALGAGTSLVTYQGVGHVNAYAVSCLGQAILDYLVHPTDAPTVTSCPAIAF